MTSRVVLCLNSGSSSLKFALFRLSGANETRVAEGAVERIGLEGGHFRLAAGGILVAERADHFDDHEAAISATMRAVGEGKLPEPHAIGHRVVHGGRRHLYPERIDEAVVDSLRRIVPFAPLHLPVEIRAIEAVRQLYPEVPQVACFDTAFFRDLPEVARRFALPQSFYDEGVYRYGFHGLSYEYIVDLLGPKLGARSVVAHLGNGASMVALRDQKAVDTTMGLTPAGGFMMGTRSGDLDPGLCVYLLDAGFGARDLERLVNREAGLLGVSGSTSDMKTILDRRLRDQRASLAFEMFSYQARKTVGALAAALGGIDTLVFTGGIGEHAPPVRDRICSGLEHLGLQLDPEHNRRSDEVISTSASRCTVRVVGTNEELMIARQTVRLLFGA